MTRSLFSGRVQKQSLAKIDAMLERAPARVAARLKTEFRHWGEDWERGVQDRFGSGDVETGSAGATIRSRTNTLRRSLRAEVSGSTLSDLRLRCVTRGVPYARIQEFGGEIRPKKGRLLAFPTEIGLTAAGRPKGGFESARRFIEQHKGETFFLRAKKSGSGAVLLMWNRPNRKRNATVAAFVMVPRVELSGPRAPRKKGPSRLGFFDTWKGLAERRRAGLRRLAAKGVA